MQVTQTHLNAFLFRPLHKYRRSSSRSVKVGKIRSLLKKRGQSRSKVVLSDSDTSGASQGMFDNECSEDDEELFGSADESCSGVDLGGSKWGGDAGSVEDDQSENPPSVG